jgi:hypothetical protein
MDKMHDEIINFFADNTLKSERHVILLFFKS